MRKLFRYIYNYIIFTRLRELKYSVIRKILYKENYDNMLKYKDIHKGERCFIVATGPSLTVSDVEMIKDEYTFCLNSGIYLLEKTKWIPSFYVIQDREVYQKLKGDLEILEKYKIIKFIGDTASKNVSKNTVLYRLKLYDHLMGGKEINFSKDCYKHISDGWTVTYSAIQIAVYMGFNQIYLIGCDSDYSVKMHADGCVKDGDKEKMVKGQENFGKVSDIAYKCAYAYAKKNKIGIYNCTRGGKLEVFPRKSLEEILIVK